MERKLVPVPSRFVQPRRREELEFLPAALEVIETPVSSAGRVMMGSIIVLVAAAVVWASIAEVDIVATASGRIIPAGQNKVIQPLEIGTVKRIAVAEGDHVKAGDLLVEMDSTISTADRVRIARDLVEAELDIARLRALATENPANFEPPPGADPTLTEEKRRQMLAQLAQQRAKIDTLDGQIASKTAERDQAQATIAKIDASLPLLQEKKEVYDQLRENQLASRIAWLDAARQLVEMRQDRVVWLHHVEAAAAQISTLTAQRDEARADFRRLVLEDLSKAVHYAAEQRQELVKAAQRAGLQELRAPVSGTVEQLSVHTIGGVATPAQPMMVIVPDNSTLEVEAMLPNRDVGFVHAGQPAEIKVEAFTYTRYGLLHGKIRHLGRDALRSERDGLRADQDAPARPQSSQPPASAATPAYVARISLTEKAVETEQGPRPLEPGMAVTAEIRTGQRAIMAYLLSPFMRYTHDALRER